MISAEKVVHTAKVEGDGAGFDIHSFFPDGRPKFVEVKTTTGPKDTDFLISANEVAFSATHPDNYELCRVFAFDPRPNIGRCYSIPGDIAKWLRTQRDRIPCEGSGCARRMIWIDLSGGPHRWTGPPARPVRRCQRCRWRGASSPSAPARPRLAVLGVVRGGPDAIAQPHDAMMSLRALHQGFSDGPLWGLSRFRYAWSDTTRLPGPRTLETRRPAEAGLEHPRDSRDGQSQSCTSRTYQHLRPAVLTTGGAGCSSATREKPYPSTCQ